VSEAAPLSDGSADGSASAVLLRGDAEKVAGALPPLLAEAQHLAASVALGRHGRRRAGMGETFWQYRQAVPGTRYTFARQSGKRRRRSHSGRIARLRCSIAGRPTRAPRRSGRGF